MRLFSTLVLILACCVLAIYPLPVGAAVIFQDDFEHHPLGSRLPDLNPPIGERYGPSSNATIVIDSTSVPPSGGAGDSEWCVGVSGLAPGIAYQDLMLVSAADQLINTGQVVTFSLDYYVASNPELPGDGAPGPSIMALNTEEGWTGDNYGFSWGLTVNRDGAICQWAPNASVLTPTGFSARIDTWIPIEVIADYGALTYTATVDGHTFTGEMLVDNFRRFEISPNSLSVFYCFDNVKIEDAFPAAKPGDTNRDGDIDADDAATMAANWLSTSATWSMGDFNNDNKVDDVDATILAANWQSGATSAAVPEPTTAAALLALGLAALMACRRKR